MAEAAYDCDGVSVEHDPTIGTFTILLDRGENRFNPSFVQDISKSLAVVEEAGHPKALVITGRGKFFSNGLDIDWMSTHPKETPSMIEALWKILGRILVMDCRTVAAINGHAFGAGLFLSLACDYRVMRTKRGFVNFPEVNLGMRLAKVSYLGLLPSFLLFLLTCAINRDFLSSPKPSVHLQRCEKVS